MATIVDEDAGGKGTLIHCWWECKLLQPLQKTVWRLLKKLEIDLSYNPEISLLGPSSKECESAYNKDSCTSMFIEALFTRTKLWKQPGCPTTDESIKKMCYLYTMEFYSATKKNEILSFAGKWMEVENITLSEVIQTQKVKSCMYSLICRI
jgi:hypothetical protein